METVPARAPPAEGVCASYYLVSGTNKATRPEEEMKSGNLAWTFKFWITINELTWMTPVLPTIYPRWDAGKVSRKGAIFSCTPLSNRKL